MRLAVFVITATLYGWLFNRESVLSYSIGYNLYGAERVLDGETPYRDFHTLYPPATLYFNAAVFKLFGMTLYNALLGVLVFKLLHGVRALPLRGKDHAAKLGRGCGTLFADLAKAERPVQSRPNALRRVVSGAGSLFSVEQFSERKESLASPRGLSLGVVTLFKHNIGGYALIGTLIFVFA